MVWCGVALYHAHAIALRGVVWMVVVIGFGLEREREVERTKIDVRTNMNNICIETRNKKKKKGSKTSLISTCSLGSVPNSALVASDNATLPMHHAF